MPFGQMERGKIMNHCDDCEEEYKQKAENFAREICLLNGHYAQNHAIRIIVEYVLEGRKGETGATKQRLEMLENSNKQLIDFLTSIK